MHLLGANPHVSLANLAQKYGPLMSIRLGAKLCIICTSPDNAKQFLKVQDANFGDRPYMSHGHHFLYGQQDVAFPSSNPTWRNLKKIFTMELTSTPRLEASRHIRVDEVAGLVRTIYGQRSVDLKSQLAMLINNRISRMVLNKRHAGVADDPNSTQAEKDFSDMILNFFRLSGVFVPGDYIPALKWLDLGGLEAQMKEHGKRMDAFITDILTQHRERRANGPVPKNEHDMVDALLDQMEMKDAPFQLSEVHVKVLILDAILAATDTTTATTEWAMAELLRNPSFMAKAHAELDAVVGRDRQLQESDLHKLPYLEAVVKEVFRLHPVAPLLMPHDSSQASQAFGHDFPAKALLLVNVWAMGRDPKVWPKPLVFNPDRFLEPNFRHIDAKGQHFELLTFGSGRRVCPGMSLLLIVQFILASLLHSFDWSLPVDVAPEDLDMTEHYGLTLPRAGPLPCMANPRLPPQLYEGC